MCGLTSEKPVPAVKKTQPIWNVAISCAWLRIYVETVWRVKNSLKTCYKVFFPTVSLTPRTLSWDQDSFRLTQNGESWKAYAKR